MAKAKKEGPEHIAWREDVEAEIDQHLEILKRRRGKGGDLTSLSVEYGMSEREIKRRVQSLTLYFLPQHKFELLRAEEYTGFPMEDLIREAVKEFMVKIQKSIQKKPFLGSPMTQRYGTKVRDELYKEWQANDPDEPDFTV